MTLYRCQARLKHESGFPRDDVSNTFWFETSEGAPTVAKAEICAELVRDFYTAIKAPQTAAIMNFIAPSIATVGHEVRVAPIDPEDGEDERGEGQPPLFIEAFDFLGRTATTAGAPSEVALCLSFRHHLASVFPPGQRRGRVYVGPIESAHIAVRAGTNIPEPIGALTAAVRGGGVALRDQAVDADVNWVVYSRPHPGRPLTFREGRPPLREIPARPGQTHLVTQVWTDNAFDTQRRRGERATTKTFA